MFQRRNLGQNVKTPSNVDCKRHRNLKLIFPYSDKSPADAERRLFKTPIKTPNYRRSTTASRLRMSPRKHLSPHWRPKESSEATPCPRSGFATSPNDKAPKPSKFFTKAFKKSEKVSPISIDEFQNCQIFLF